MNLDDLEMGAVKDWRKALKSQPTYRVVNRTFRGQAHFVSVVAITGVVLLIVFYVFPKKSTVTAGVFRSMYNNTYPLTKPIVTNGLYTYRIGIIADLDTKSKSRTDKNLWYSYFKKGYLTYDPSTHSVIVSWDKSEPIKLTSSYSLKDRGMELSELVVFDGRLLTFDDRTGLIFEIINNKALPWVLLLDGDGRKTKGFKSEWATVKNELLYVGSMGKEWTTPAGDFESNDPQYIKVVATNGLVKNVRWVEEYSHLREVLDIYWPGYMIHESGVWSEIHQRWFFLPRRCSKETYNETLDEHRGCSWLLMADSSLKHVEATKIPNSRNSRGFSSFKFIPNTNDYIIVALRTEELNGKTATYITSFTIDGNVLMDDMYISDVKYEGFEFI